MTKQGLRVVCLMMALMALMLIPSLASAQVTVKHVKVTVGSALGTTTFCDSNGTVCDVHVWDLTAGGVGLTAGQTLVLTQTALIASVGSNFDTSDRARTGLIKECNSGDKCTVSISLDTGAGFPLTPDYTNTTGDPLDNFNADTGGNTHCEFSPYGAPVINVATYTLQLGYADTAHTLAPSTCTSTTVPSPFTGATVFKGAPVNLAGVCTGCFDAGALLITAKALDLTTVTQGGWGAPAHGNNPGTILNANFASINPLKIGSAAGGCFQLTFNSANAVRAFLPAGGPPDQLAASATNPTSSAAGVFAGQVLALQINVSFSNLSVLPFGLGSYVLPSGPAAGKTVNQVLAAANLALGCGTLPSYASSISELNDIVTSINELFD